MPKLEKNIDGNVLYRAIRNIDYYCFVSQSPISIRDFSKRIKARQYQVRLAIEYLHDLKKVYYDKKENVFYPLEY